MKKSSVFADNARKGITTPVEQVHPGPTDVFTPQPDIYVAPAQSSRRPRGDGGFFLEFLHDLMVGFWTTVFPILLVSGIVVVGVSSYLGIGIWATLSLLVLGWAGVGLFLAAAS